MPIYQFKQSIITDSGNLTPASKSVSGEGVLEIIKEAIAAPQTDMEFACTLDVSEIKGIAILCTVDATLETNDSTTPGDTIALKANQLFEWYDGHYYTNLITTDITSLFLTVGGTTAFDFFFKALFDATP